MENENENNENKVTENTSATAASSENKPSVLDKVENAGFVKNLSAKTKLKPNALVGVGISLIPSLFVIILAIIFAISSAVGSSGGFGGGSSGSNSKWEKQAAKEAKKAAKEAEKAAKEAEKLAKSLGNADYVDDAIALAKAAGKAVSSMPSAIEKPTVVKTVKKPSATPSSSFEYDLTEDGKGVVVKRYKGKMSKNLVIVIPEIIEDFPVVEVGPGQSQKFLELNRAVNPEVASIYIFVPQSVTDINSGAFNTPTGYEYVPVTVDVDLSKLKYVGAKAFYNCLVANHESGKTFDSGFRIGEYAFKKSLFANPKLTLPQDGKVLGEEAFYESNITELVWLGTDANKNGKFSNLDMGSEVFSKTNITTLVLPEGINRIGYSMFAECKKLTSVTFPSTLKNINNGAFSKCENLTEVNFPENAKIYYDYDVFEGCSKLSLKLKAAIKETGYDGQF